MNEAIILAGGFGTRLKSVVNDKPKPMASILDKPFLDYLVRYLKHYDITHIVFSVGYLAHIIESYFGSHYQGIAISYAKEEEPLGTGGGIRLALEKCTTNDILILNGDSFFDINLDTFWRFHKAKNAIASLAIRKVDNVGRFGEVVLNMENEVIAFQEKSDKIDEGFINGGVYLIQKNALNHFKLYQSFSLEKDFFQKNILQSKLFGKLFDGYFIDIGIPEEYEKAQKDLLLFKY